LVPHFDSATGTRAGYPMKLSIVIPCYNEMHTIEAIVEKVLQVQMALERELIIVDD
jgi:glycosyltransferase involved in cell wall biosynthesis